MYRGVKKIHTRARSYFLIIVAVVLLLVGELIRKLFCGFSVHPMIKVTNQLVAAPTGSNVHIQCYVETSPKAMHSWAKINGKTTRVALARPVRRFSRPPRPRSCPDPIYMSPPPTRTYSLLPQSVRKTNEPDLIQISATVGTARFDLFYLRRSAGPCTQTRPIR